MSTPNSTRLDQKVAGSENWKQALPQDWLSPDGEKVACSEKLKVLEENIAELAELAQEALEDAVIMGVDEREIRDTLSRLITGLINPYKK